MSNIDKQIARQNRSWIGHLIWLLCQSKVWGIKGGVRADWIVVFVMDLGYNDFMSSRTSNTQWQLDELQASYDRLADRLTYLADRVSSLELIAGVEPPDEDEECYESDDTDKP